METLAVVSQILLALAGVFLMIVVLLQRGRGGGLAGAFGGLGGQSAFGTKAGDVFTRITIIIAIIWVALAGGSGYFLRASSEQRGETFEGNVQEEEGAGALEDGGELEIPEAPELPDADAPTDAAAGNVDDAVPDGEEDGAADSVDDSTGVSEPAPAADSPTEE